jgi:hypothetical protein
MKEKNQEDPDYRFIGLMSLLGLTAIIAIGLNEDHQLDVQCGEDRSQCLTQEVESVQCDSLSGGIMACYPVNKTIYITPTPTIEPIN